jgi:hypothetical protein
MQSWPSVHGNLALISGSGSCCIRFVPDNIPRARSRCPSGAAFGGERAHLDHHQCARHDDISLISQAIKKAANFEVAKIKRRIKEDESQAAKQQRFLSLLKQLDLAEVTDQAVTKHGIQCDAPCVPGARAAAAAVPCDVAAASDAAATSALLARLLRAKCVQDQV